jgi:5'-nucleotidase
LKGKNLAPNKPLVMVTNDDGVFSPGIVALSESLSPHASVAVIAPEGQQSAAGMSLTFHRPLRVEKVLVHGRLCHAVSGSPADSVMVGVNKMLPRHPDMVVSGINIGENLTIQDILASGTVAAAMEAALLGIPSIAFSMAVPSNRRFSHGQKDSRFDLPARVATEIALEVLENGLPKEVNLLNVNFPWNTKEGTKVKFTSIEVRKYRDYVIERKDPRGRPYYWVWGARLPTFEKDSDVYAVHKLGAISISPLSLDLTPTVAKQVRLFGGRLKDRIATMYQNLSSLHK